jgi:hypothetical protein
MPQLQVLIATLFGALLWSPACSAADTPEELYHAKHWLEKADRDYDGHRGKAIGEINNALKKLGHDPNAHPVKIPQKPIHEKQWKSDDQLKHARKLLKEAEKRIASKGDQKHQAALGDIAKAVEELDVALRKR